VRPGTGAADTSAADPGAIYLCDVGWNTWEEVDVARAPGRDFGWPCYEGLGPQSAYQAFTPPHDGCDAIGTVTSPIITYHHSDPAVGTPPGFTGNAVIGGAFYTGSSWPAQYRGAFFFFDYVADWMRVATVDASDQLVSVSTFGSAFASPVDLVPDPATGDLVYVSLENAEVRRIRWTLPSGNSPPVVVAAGSPTIGLAPLTVNFSSTGTYDPDNDPYTLDWEFGDGASATTAAPSHTFQAPGTYAVVLSADDGVGGIGRDTVIVTVAASFAFPTAPVLDPFDRANGALGG